MASFAEKLFDEMVEQDESSQKKKGVFQPILYESEVHYLPFKRTNIRYNERRCRERAEELPWSSKRKDSLAKHESYYPGYVKDGKVFPGLRPGSHELVPELLEHDDPTLSELSDFSDSESVLSYGFGRSPRPGCSSGAPLSPSAGVSTHQLGSPVGQSTPVWQRQLGRVIDGHSPKAGPSTRGEQSPHPGGSAPSAPPQWLVVPDSPIFQPSNAQANEHFLLPSPVLSRTKKARLEAFAKMSARRSRNESAGSSSSEVEPMLVDEPEAASGPRASSLVVERGSKFSGAPAPRSPATTTTPSSMFLLIPRSVSSEKSRAQIQKFQTKFGAGLSRTDGLFDRRTTHVVLEQEDSLFEWAQGIVFDKWVLEWDWLVDSNDWDVLLFEQYSEMKEHGRERLPSKAERRSYKDFFAGLAFLLAGPYNLTFQEDQLRELLMQAGGLVVSRPEDLVSPDMQRVCIVVEPGFYTGENRERLINKAGVRGWRFAGMDWVYLSILRGHIQPICDPLSEPLDRVDLWSRSTYNLASRAGL